MANHFSISNGTSPLAAAAAGTVSAVLGAGLARAGLPAGAIPGAILAQPAPVPPPPHPGSLPQDRRRAGGGKKRLSRALKRARKNKQARRAAPHLLDTLMAPPAAGARGLRWLRTNASSPAAPATAAAAAPPLPLPAAERAPRQTSAPPPLDPSDVTALAPPARPPHRADSALSPWATERLAVIDESTLQAIAPKAEGRAKGFVANIRGGNFYFKQVEVYPSINSPNPQALDPTKFLGAFADPEVRPWGWHTMLQLDHFQLAQALGFVVPGEYVWTVRDRAAYLGALQIPRFADFSMVRHNALRPGASSRRTMPDERRQLSELIGVPKMAKLAVCGLWIADIVPGENWANAGLQGAASWADSPRLALVDADCVESYNSRLANFARDLFPYLSLPIVDAMMVELEELHAHFAGPSGNPLPPDEPVIGCFTRAEVLTQTKWFKTHLHQARLAAAQDHELQHISPHQANAAIGDFLAAYLTEAVQRHPSPLNAADLATYHPRPQPAPEEPMG